MRLALMFRREAHWTTGTCFEAALKSMGIPHAWVDNNHVMGGRVSLAGFDAVLTIDDGFGVYHYPTLPPNNVFYCIDAHNGFAQHYQQHITQFGRIYCAQYELGVALLKRHGLESTWMPLAYDDVQMTYTQVERDTDVMFVASWSTDERKEMKRIVEEKYHGITKECYRQEMGGYLSQSKIGWNSFGMQTDWVVRKDHTNQRLFEVMGCGALLLTPRPDVPDLDMLGLHDGVHLVLWDSVGDLLEKTDYYLAHAEERERIAAAGRAWVMAGHTYKHRVAKILEDLEG